MDAGMTRKTASLPSSGHCTYCLETKPLADFGTVEHVMPAALGGAWTTDDVCNSCQRRANEVADHLIAKDFLVQFLRSAYQIPDRTRRVPLAPRFTVPLQGQRGSVVVTVESDGAKLEGRMSPTVAALLQLHGETNQDEARLRQLVAADIRERLHDPRELSRHIQKERTPPEAWSRFIAKLGLACGRKAYGGEWLDGAHAKMLSADLLSDEPPKLSQQREHYPPLGETWPFLPPKHVLWIDDVADAAVLHVVLFGQVLGAVPINHAGARSPSMYTAWRFDPKKRDFSHTSYPAIWHAMVAMLATQTGRNVVSVLDPNRSFTFIEDGPEGPMDIPVPTRRADSPIDALRVVARHQRGELGTSTNATTAGAQSQPRATRVGRNEPCPCGSGRKYKRCCGG